MSRRYPNPWVAVPSLAAGLLGGLLGWLITDVSCRREVAPGVIESCPGWAAGMAVAGFLAGTIGMAVVVVLVYRSLAEYREARSRGEEPPGPGCEV